MQRALYVDAPVPRLPQFQIRVELHAVLVCTTDSNAIRDPVSNNRAHPLGQSTDLCARV